jgi:hypothetical protein
MFIVVSGSGPPDQQVGARKFCSGNGNAEYNILISRHGDAIRLAFRRGQNASLFAPVASADNPL